MRDKDMPNNKVKKKTVYKTHLYVAPDIPVEIMKILNSPDWVSASQKTKTILLRSRTYVQHIEHFFGKYIKELPLKNEFYVQEQEYYKSHYPLAKDVPSGILEFFNSVDWKRAKSEKYRLMGVNDTYYNHIKQWFTQYLPQMPLKTT
jgi:hypothetical protein